MIDKEDKILQDFFSDAKCEIPNDGFSKKVMSALPKAKSRHKEKILNFIINSIMVISVTFFFILDGLTFILNFIRDFMIKFIQYGNTASINQTTVTAIIITIVGFGFYKAYTTSIDN